MAELHTCTQIDSGIDCAACKLAQLCDKKTPEQPTDEYSISEELTAKGSGNYAIFYLVIAAAATLACVVFFTWLFL